ncbi:carbon-nitrogen family hydrolase [Vallicoccus soli]|uniref:Carbon-nitrogen family hydrolase n=1 Tax=Vallicoccus soli TaxID=2339232 RepID=A0A3A3Z1H8_9ACTN|nr:carbon-nitrogen family hydrolase [Vallicoccus soli]RJK94247.1 carbon-nitrogen family hydrolase [Vallicoccus soli]
MRTALLQLATDLDQPLAARVERAAALVREQRGADLVVLPELWPVGAFGYDGWADAAEPLDGPTVRAMADAARDTGAHVHMGSFVERDGDRLHNTSVVLGPDGEVAATYRKVHLFGLHSPERGEPSLLSPGEGPVVWDAPWGPTGLATCYDLRFPELFRALVDRGARTLLLVAGWPEPRIAHWSLLVRARAVEDQLLVVACNAAGRQGSTALGGRSLVVDAWGALHGEASPSEQVLEVDVDPAATDGVRERFPVLDDRVLR